VRVTPRSVAMLATLVCAAVVVSAAVSAPARRLDGVPRLRHVFLIVGENQGLNALTRSRSPYLIARLKPQSAFLTSYTGVTLGGSLANYLGMVAGRFTRCDLADDLPTVRCSHPWDSLFSQLGRRGDSWREWAQSADSACDIFDHGSAWSRNIYTAHHQPAIYLTRIHGHGYDEALTPKRACRANALSMGTTGPNDTSAFDAALARGNMGAFNLIVPNDCEDGHDPCPPVNDGVRQFDDFLRREIPKIEASPAYRRGGTIVITYDSGTSPRHKQILFMVLGRQVRPGVYRGGPYSHYSLLRTLEDGFGISQHLAGAAHARPIAAIWR
jgi:phosphatidylinositol-3-phosphatase